MSKQRIDCTSCEKKIPVASFCPRCGRPTSVATAQERIFWEMGQWERAKPAAPPRTVQPAGAKAPEVAPPAVRTLQTGKPAAPASRPAPTPPRVAPAAAVGGLALDVEEVEQTVAAPEPTPEDNRVLLIRRLQRGTAHVAQSTDQTPDAEIEPPQEPVVAQIEEAKEPVAAPLAQPEKETPATVPVATRSQHGESMVDSLELVASEAVTATWHGRCGVRSATLVLTTFRIAIVTGGRTSSVRWIPLEEVSNIETAWRGAPTVTLAATVELLRFRMRSSSTLRHAVEAIRREVDSARMPGSRRHSGELIQLWCERTSDVWESSAGRLRLFVRRHPVFSLAWSSSLAPLAYLAARTL